MYVVFLDEVPFRVLSRWWCIREQEGSEVGSRKLVIYKGCQISFVPNGFDEVTSEIVFFPYQASKLFEDHLLFLVYIHQAG